MAVKGINCLSAQVSDLQRSKQFYGNALGWEIQTDEEGVAGFSFGHSYLVIHTGDHNSTARLYAGGMHALVEVDNVDAEHARLGALGVPVGTLVNQPWGYRTFSFSDPDGYSWEYGQPKSVHE